MNPSIFPRKIRSYLNDVGVRALDSLTGNIGAAEPESTEPTDREGETPGEPAPPNAMQNLAGQWRLMTREEKEDFVDRLIVAVGEVSLLASAVPTGLKIGKKAAKAARKVVKKQTKKLQKGKAQTKHVQAKGVSKKAKKK